MSTGSFSIHDAGARLYSFPSALSREDYFELVRKLTDTYPAQKYEPDTFSFSASREQFCEISQDYIHVSELIGDDLEQALDKITRVARLAAETRGITSFEALDVTVAGLLDTTKLGGRDDVIYFSGHEFLESYLFHQADMKTLGIPDGLEDLGFQFAFKKGDNKYGVRVTPFESKKRFLLLDLQLAYKEDEYEIAEIRHKIRDGASFLEKEVVPFLERVARTRNIEKG